ncbi:MAG: Spy/CpxP family protein refolding chaperone [Caldimonas sp.]
MPASGHRRLRAVMIAMTMTVLAAISLAAWGQPTLPTPPAGMEHAGQRMGHGMHGGGMHGGMGGMMFGGSPERAGRMIDRMLDGLNASDAQRSQIKQIAAAAAADMRTQMQARRGLRERGMQILTAPNVDPAAAEQLRQQMLQQHDGASRRMTQALLDVARVLTPEQRARIGERMKDRQARRDERMKRMERTAPPR